MSIGPAYRYSATVVRVVDGDTILLDIDLGFGITLRGQSIRLAGCNARELHDPGGRSARDHLAAMLPAGTPVVASTVRADKYGGRYDAAVTLADGSDLAAELLAAEWVAAWDGRGFKPVPPWPRPQGGL